MADHFPTYLAFLCLWVGIVWSGGTSAPTYPAGSGFHRGVCAIIKVRGAARFAMANFWASVSLRSLAMMAADASEVPVLAMISAGGCTFSRERISLTMVRHVLTVL